MSSIDPALLEDWRGAVGRRTVETQRLELEPLRRYAVAVGAGACIEQALPPLAHWAWFLPLPLDTQIGEDGHPRRGDFLPAITLPRRMFAAAQIEFCDDLAIGEEADLTSTIVDVAHKSGKSGDLVFAEVEKVLSQAGAVRVRERQSYVYRGDGGPTAMPTPLADAIEGEIWRPTEVSLFRFSAVTFNGHRIHYDQPYATQVEGYPSLVVHGPFTAAKLAGLAGRPGALASFSFRAQSPLFLGQPIYLQRQEDGARAVRCDGAVAMTAQARLK